MGEDAVCVERCQITSGCGGVAVVTCSLCVEPLSLAVEEHASAAINPDDVNLESPK